jgi:hypothetical protein
VARSVNAGSRSACSKWARFFGPSAAVVALAALGGALVGCVIHDHDEDDWEDEDGWVPPPGSTGGNQDEEPQPVSIDTGSAVDATPGEGVGLFVEYAEGGLWRIWTSCDTAYSGFSCAFDVIVAVDDDSEIFSVSSEELEGDDEAGTSDAGSGFFRAETSSDLDGVRFETTPGAVLRVDTFLDDQPAPRFVYWVGDEVVHQGAPTNPVDFVPTEP